jgi:adenine-specific DNA-methyltransferase
MSRNPAFDKLITLLKELFQLDQPDLDFGIYRIMHARAREISQFLDRDLLPQVKESFSQYRTADKADLEKELQEVIGQANNLGVDPDTSPKVLELRRKIAEQGVDIGGLEHEVYDHLYKFFRRYYHEGDFLAKRVYKPGVYAIPYEGEEVKLHWANKDQYYIKTSECLRDYAFVLKPEAKDDPMRVHFRLVDAAEGEHGNIKAGEDQNQVFILAREDFIAEEDGESGKELVIRFEYRPATLADWSEEAKEQATAAARKKPPVQKVLRDIAVCRIFSMDDDVLKPWLTELGQTHIKANGEPADYSRLAGHLNRYTCKNTFDYFIHKDLEGFLRRELDFYIKNEVMHLDDIESESIPRVEQYLAKIKVIRRIAGKIIDFLAQLENFQKKLWLKKKFVTETFWCIRVGRIPEAFYPEIAANDEQREEWISLHAINEVQGDMFAAAYSEPLTSEFLKAHPTLMVDTRHFDEAFTHRLLEAMGDIDGRTDGVLFHGENFQVLGSITSRYVNDIDCVYIDPPYNTSENTFVYKNLYKHSSWMSMMQDRLVRARSITSDSGVVQCAIDDTETAVLRGIMDSIYGEENYMATIVAEANPAGQNLRPNTPALSHDYCHVYARNINSMTMLLRGLTVEEKATYKQCDPSGAFMWDNLRRRGGNSRPTDRPGQWYPLYVDITQGHVSISAFEGAEEVWPIDPKGIKRIWRTNPDGTKRGIESGEISVLRKAGRIEVVKKTRAPEGKKPKTLWGEAKYSATTHGTKLLIDILGTQIFSYPKSIFLVVDCLRYWAGEAAKVLDFFAGSGTTGHAVINLNREDGGRRKFILVEMGDYFDTVLLPRLKKITFTPEWKAGKPRRLATAEEADRSPRMMKVIRLESYEDALNNLELRRDENQASLLKFTEAQKPGGLREQYLLRYMLDVETRGSRSLLDIAAFTDPTAYRLKVKRPGSEETREVNVDLLETFNWLIGLTVATIAAPQTVTAAFTRDTDPDLPKDAPRRLLLDGPLREDGNAPWWFRAVAGAVPDGRKTLVIWRKLTDDPEQDNLVLDEWFKKQGYSSKDSEFDLIYVNGDNNLENLRQPDDTWKVRLIEEDFHRLMFEETEA